MQGTFLIDKVYHIYNGVSVLRVALESSLKVFKNRLNLSLAQGGRVWSCLGKGLFRPIALILGWLNPYIVAGHEVTTCHLDSV